MSEIKWNTRMVLEGNLDEDDDDRLKDQKAAPSGKAGDFNFIGKCLIRYCGPGKDVTFPEGFATISGAVFQNCEGAASITSITIPKSITRIDPHAFSYCTNLSEIRVESENQHYSVIDGLLLERDGSALYLHTCSAAKSGVLEIPEGISRIEEGAFGGCKDLTGVIIPGSVCDIGRDAFVSCSGLAHVTIQEGVRFIGERAFSGCTNLTHLTFPKSICEIECGAFYDTGMSEEAIQAAYDQADENRFLESEVWERFALLDIGWIYTSDDEV